MDLQIEELGEELSKLQAIKKRLLPLIGAHIVIGKMEKFHSTYGLVYPKRRFTASFPKALEQKRAIQQFYGEEGYLALSSIPSPTFTSKAQERFDECAAEGKIFDIPFTNPTIETVYAFNRNKKL